jgi:hypothetical protein
MVFAVAFWHHTGVMTLLCSSRLTAGDVLFLLQDFES